MRVAKRDSERVGGVGRLRLFAEAELSLHHLLHLLFRSGARAGDAGFHFARRITVGGDIRLRGGEQNDTTNFGEPKRRAHVQSREDRFHRHSVGGEFVNELSNHLVNFSKAFGEAGARGETQRAETKHLRGLAMQFDDSITCGAGQRGVETKNAKGFARD